MKLDPATTQADIEALLTRQSEAVYGADRTQELAGQIAHASAMLAAVAQRPLDLIGPPPDTSGIAHASGR